MDVNAVRTSDDDELNNFMLLTSYRGELHPNSWMVRLRTFSTSGLVFAVEKAGVTFDKCVSIKI